MRPCTLPTLSLLSLTATATLLHAAPAPTGRSTWELLLNGGVGSGGEGQRQLPFLGFGLAKGNDDDDNNKDASTDEVGVKTLGALESQQLVPSLSSLKDVLPTEHYLALVEHIHTLPELRRVALSDSPSEVYSVTEGEKALLTYAGIRFMDVTEEDGAPAAAAAAVKSNPKHEYKYPTKLKYTVEELDEKYYDHIDTDRMKERLTKFSSFRTRYYRSSEGQQSQAWLKSTVESIAYANKHLNISVSEFPHPWGQNSIILKYPSSNESKGKVIVGAHQDSTNFLPFLAAPGADDDGSGTTTLLEVLSVLTRASFVPENYNVEFHWYSAEEGGMLGSNAIAADYLAKFQKGDDEDVRGMLQMDMTAYVKPGTEERIGIINDYVSAPLTKFIHTLIKAYNTIPYVETKCGYACSDHSAWTKIGKPSAFAIEASFEDSNTRNIHTSGDTIHVDGFSFNHMKQFVRLASAFILELSA